MKTCPSCGRTTGDDSLDFCPACGAYYVTRPAGAPVPDTSILPKDPMERGSVLLDAGRLAEGVECYREVLADRGQPDDVTYRLIVDSIVGCMLGIALQQDDYRKAGMVELALLMPDREPLMDIMHGLKGSLGVCSIQNGVLGLANGYMYLYLDCFSLYTDIRDLREVCETAYKDLGDMVDQAIGMVDAIRARGPGPLEWLSAYHSFCESVLDAVYDIQSKASEQEQKRLAKAWADSNRTTYAGMVRNAFLLDINSTAAGRISSKVLRKSGDSQLRAFEKTYLAGPKR